MSGDVHVRFRERLGGRFPRATRRILHCKTETQARKLRQQLAERIQDCGLEMHPQKTRVVYCKDSRRTHSYEHIQFGFLGYTFRPRRVASRHGHIFTGFTPAVSRQAMKAMR